MLHGLRGQLSHVERVHLLLVPRAAGEWHLSGLFRARPGLIGAWFIRKEKEHGPTTPLLVSRRPVWCIV